LMLSARTTGGAVAGDTVADDGGASAAGWARAAGGAVAGDGCTCTVREMRENSCDQAHTWVCAVSPCCQHQRGQGKRCVFLFMRWRGITGCIVKQSRGLARVSPRLQVSSSAGKPPAGGGALPKKGQGQRRFVSIAECYSARRPVLPAFIYIFGRASGLTRGQPSLSRRDFGRACTTRVPLQSRLRTFLVAAQSHSGWPTVASSHI
jgi:hypothetical protein